MNKYQAARRQEAFCTLDTLSSSTRTHHKEQVPVPGETSHFFSQRNNHPLSPFDLQATDE